MIRDITHAMREQYYEKVAYVANEAIRAWCVAIDDSPLAPWDVASEIQRLATVAGVRQVSSGTYDPRGTHESWVEHKRAEGWIYGREKCVRNHTHPGLVPYEQLPTEQRMKNKLFSAVVQALLYGETLPAETLEQRRREIESEAIERFCKEYNGLIQERGARASSTVIVPSYKDGAKARALHPGNMPTRAEWAEVISNASADGVPIPVAAKRLGFMLRDPVRSGHPEGWERPE